MRGILFCISALLCLTRFTLALKGPATVIPRPMRGGENRTRQQRWSGFRVQSKAIAKAASDRGRRIQNSKSRASSQAPKTYIHSPNKVPLYKRRLTIHIYTTTTTKFIHIKIKPNETTRRRTYPKGKGVKESKRNPKNTQFQTEPQTKLATSLRPISHSNRPLIKIQHKVRLHPRPTQIHIVVTTP